jgi:hypothetical protein
MCFYGGYLWQWRHHGREARQQRRRADHAKPVIHLPANSGNATVKIVRITVLHVSADPATERYASTMYVMEDAKME